MLLQHPCHPERNGPREARTTHPRMSSRAKRSSAEPRACPERRSRRRPESNGDLLLSFTNFTHHKNHRVPPVPRLRGPGIARTQMIAMSSRAWRSSAEPRGCPERRWRRRPESNGDLPLSFCGLHPPQKNGCPILATLLFLWLGWDSTNPNHCRVIPSVAFSLAPAFAHF